MHNKHCSRHAWAKHRNKAEQRIETKMEIAVVKEKLTGIWDNLNGRVENIFFSIKTGLAPKSIT